LKEIGKNGEGRPVEIRQMIEEVFGFLLHLTKNFVQFL